jgi:hypothetical protein
MEAIVSVNFPFAISHRRTRFILVNHRLPHANDRCAMCGEIVEKGYVRDFRTGLIYCDTQCFAGGDYLVNNKNHRRKVS